MMNIYDDITIFVDGEDKGVIHLQSRSIDNIFAAKRMIEEHPPMSDRSPQLRILSNEVLAKLFIRQFITCSQRILDSNPAWVTYNESFLFYIYYFTKRHREVLREWGVVLSHPVYREIEIALRLSSSGGVVSYDDKEYRSYEVSKLAPISLDTYSSIVGNGPGHRSLIPLLDDEASLNSAKNASTKVYYDEKDVTSLPYLTLALISRIEEGNNELKISETARIEEEFRFD